MSEEAGYRVIRRKTHRILSNWNENWRRITQWNELDRFRIRQVLLYKNCLKNTGKKCKYNVQRYIEIYRKSGKMSLILILTVDIGNPINLKKMLPNLSEGIYSYIHLLHNDHGSTVIVVTHKFNFNFANI